MSDWIRFFDPLGLVALILTCLAWGAGGWLLVRAWFLVRPGERLVTGMATGFVVFLTLVILFNPLLGLPAAIYTSAGLIFAAGLVSARFKRLDWSELRADSKDYPQVLFLFAFALIYELTLRGTSLFDEYIHLPMVSLMGTGDIPPHFYLNPDLMFAYHFSLQVFAAVLERLAQFFPWSAWDLTRGISFGFTVLLAFLWVRRLTHRNLAGVLGALAVIFGGGTRWLLLLLPPSVLNWVSQGVNLSNSGAATAATLKDALALPWAIEGGGAMPYSFAYRNGIFPPEVFSLGSSATLPALTLLLLLLLARPYPSLRRPGGVIVYTLIFAGLALSAEYLYPFVWGSILLAGLLTAIWAGRKHQAFPKDLATAWLVILGGSALISVVQGGFITEAVRNLWLGLQGNAPTTSNLYSFSLRWPPGIYSIHLGQLNPLNPRQLVALLAEIGPAILAAPLATRLAWRSIRREDWLTAALGLAALLSFVFILVFQYGMDTSSPRVTGRSVWLWLVLALPLLWWGFQRAGTPQRAWLGSLYGILLVGGVVTFAVQLTSTPNPQPSYFIDDLDQKMSRSYWNQLAPGAQILDRNPERSVAVFGRNIKARSGMYVYLPEWLKLMDDPTLGNALASGFSYVYVDEQWWNGITPEIRQTYQQPCVRLVGEVKDSSGKKYRRLLDIQACK